MRRQQTRVRLGQVEWIKILKRLEVSGKTQAEFCRSEGVSLTTLQKWSRRLRASNSSEFIELKPTLLPGTEVSSWQIEVQLPAGIWIRLRS